VFFVCVCEVGLVTSIFDASVGELKHPRRMLKSMTITKHKILNSF
jgi:hypothetical protein